MKKKTTKKGPTSKRTLRSNTKKVSKIESSDDDSDDSIKNIKVSTRRSSTKGRPLRNNEAIIVESSDNDSSSNGSVDSTNDMRIEENSFLDNEASEGEELSDNEYDQHHTVPTSPPQSPIKGKAVVTPPDTPVSSTIRKKQIKNPYLKPKTSSVKKVPAKKERAKKRAVINYMARENNTTSIIYTPHVSGFCLFLFHFLFG